jgi:hypothetical protein
MQLIALDAIILTFGDDWVNMRRDRCIADQERRSAAAVRIRIRIIRGIRKIITSTRVITSRPPKSVNLGMRFLAAAPRVHLFITDKGPQDRHA